MHLIYLKIVLSLFFFYMIFTNFKNDICYFESVYLLIIVIFLIILLN